MKEQLKKNLTSLHQRIERAAAQSGRTGADVTLIGVTKYVDSETTRALVDAGCQELGESRPQVLWQKSLDLAGLPIHWHMIGHLQRNKVKRTVACSQLIHSIDSHRLLSAIDEAACQLDQIADVLLEVNVSGDSAKHGLSSSELSPTLEFVSNLQHVKVKGLMAMAGLHGDHDQARREFAQLQKLKTDLAPDCPDNVQLDELSMGMSRDFEIAIEEGATMVRVGSLLFEGV